MLSIKYNMIKAKALKTDMPANDDEWLSAELKAAHKCSELQRLEWRWRCWWRWERAGVGGGQAHGRQNGHQGAKTVSKLIGMILRRRPLRLSSYSRNHSSDNV